MLKGEGKKPGEKEAKGKDEVLPVIVDVEKKPEDQKNTQEDEVTKELTKAKESTKKILKQLAELDALAETRQQKPKQKSEHKEKGKPNNAAEIKDQIIESSLRIQQKIEAIEAYCKGILESPHTKGEISSAQEIEDSAAELEAASQGWHEASDVLSEVKEEQEALSAMYKTYTTTLFEEGGFESVQDIYNEQDTVSNERSLLRRSLNKPSVQILRGLVYRDYKESKARLKELDARYRELEDLQNELDRVGYSSTLLPSPKYSSVDLIEHFPQRVGEQLVKRLHEYWRKQIPDKTDMGEIGEMSDDELDQIIETYIEDTLRPLCQNVLQDQQDSIEKGFTPQEGQEIDEKVIDATLDLARQAARLARDRQNFSKSAEDYEKEQKLGEAIGKLPFMLIGIVSKEFGNVSNEERWKQMRKFVLSIKTKGAEIERLSQTREALTDLREFTARSEASSRVVSVQYYIDNDLRRTENSEFIPKGVIENFSPEHWKALRKITGESEDISPEDFEFAEEIINDQLIKRIIDEPKGLERSALIDKVVGLGRADSIKPLIFFCLGDADEHTRAIAAHGLMNLAENPQLKEQIEALRQSKVSGANEMVDLLNSALEVVKEGGRDRHQVSYPLTVALRSKSEDFLINAAYDTQNRQYLNFIFTALGLSANSIRVNAVLRDFSLQGDKRAMIELAGRMAGINQGGVFSITDESTAFYFAELLKDPESQIARDAIEAITRFGHSGSNAAAGRLFEYIGMEKATDLWLAETNRQKSDRGIENRFLWLARDIPNVRVTKKLEELLDDYHEEPGSSQEGWSASNYQTKHSKENIAQIIFEQFRNVTSSACFAHLLRMPGSYSSETIYNLSHKLSELEDDPSQYPVAIAEMLKPLAHRFKESRQIDQPESFSKEAGEIIFRLEGKNPIVALSFLKNLVRSMDDEKTYNGQRNGENQYLEIKTPQQMMLPEFIEHVEKLTALCPAAARKFIEEYLLADSILADLKAKYSTEMLMIANYSTSRETAEQFDPQNNFGQYLSGLSEKLFLSPNSGNILPEELRAKILGGDLDARVSSLISSSDPTQTEIEIIKQMTDIDSATYEWIENRKAKIQQKVGSGSFQLPFGRNTYAQMLMEKELFELEGFPVLIHGTSASAAREIVENTVGARMRKKKGSPGVFFTRSVDESGKYARAACIDREAMEAQEEGKKELIFNDEPAFVLFFRDAMRDARVNFEPSYWPGEGLAGRAVDAKGTIVRVPQRAAIVIGGLEYEYTEDSNPLSAILGGPESGSTSFAGLNQEIARWLKIRSIARTGGLLDEVNKKFEESISQESRETVSKIFTQMRTKGYPEPKICEIADDYLKSTLGLSGEQGPKVAKLIEKFAASPGEDIDASTIHDYLLEHDGLIDSLDPSMSTEEISRRIDIYISYKQREILTEKKEYFDEVNKKAVESGHQELALSNGNKRLMMMGREESVETNQANARELLLKIKELRNIQLNSVIESSMMELEQEGIETPPEGSYSIVATSSTARGEAALNSDFDILVVVESDQIKRDYDGFLVKLKEKITTKLQELGHEEVDLGLMHATGFVVSLDDMYVPISTSAGRMRHHVEPTAIIDMEGIAGSQELVGKAKERMYQKLTDEKDNWVGYLESNELVGFRRMFQEGTSLILSGDAPQDVKLEFMRTIPFEVYHLISKEITRVRQWVEDRGKSDIPKSTIERLEMLGELGMIPHENVEALQAAFSDILMWRMRASIIADKTHAELDPMSLTLNERRRLATHIGAIKKLFALSPIKMEEPPLVVT